jgi:hypothetical protein
MTVAVWFIRRVNSCQRGVLLPVVPQQVGRVVGGLGHRGRLRVARAKALDPLAQVFSPVGDDLAGHAGARHRPLQLRRDALLVGGSHRHQGDQLQVRQLQGALPERHRRQGAAGDDEELVFADLQRVIDEPDPRLVVGQRPTQAGAAQA